MTLSPPSLAQQDPGLTPGTKQWLNEVYKEVISNTASIATNASDISGLSGGWTLLETATASGSDEELDIDGIPTTATMIKVVLYGVSNDITGANDVPILRARYGANTHSSGYSTSTAQIEASNNNTIYANTGGIHLAVSDWDAADVLLGEVTITKLANTDWIARGEIHKDNTHEICIPVAHFDPNSQNLTGVRLTTSGGSAILDNTSVMTVYYQ